MKNVVLLCVVLPVLIAVCGCRTPAGKPFEPTWDSLARHNEAPDWFRDAKFGIYFHWGVYSVPAFGNEWYPRNMYIKTSPEYRHQVATYGDPNTFGYPDFVPMFKAEKFNADEWAELFCKAGARFAGPVAEHHDGFAMWDSDLTPWNAADMGPRRDILGELEKAIRKQGMRFVTTFHHERNGLWLKDGRWIGHYEYVKKDFPKLLEDPQRAILYGYMPVDQFRAMWRDKLIEVIDKYRPDLMWFDAWLDEIPDQYQKEYLAHYFNKAAEWGQDVVVVTKQDMPREVAVDDYEKGRAGRLTNFAWLTDDTISRGSWCYTQDLKIKSTPEVLHVLIDIVSKNGQLLLNISPKADGTIPQDQRDVLLGVGAWLGKFGEAIYGTRPWLVYGEGPTQMDTAGHFVKMKGRYGPQDIRYTRKGSTIYAIALGWPGANQPVLLTSFATERLQGDLQVTAVSMLGSDAKIPYELRPDGLALTTPADKADDLATVFKIETTGAAELRDSGPGTRVAENPTGIGLFDKAEDIGNVRRSGSVQYNSALKEYRVTGGGANMWGTEDAFHFVYRKLAGDAVMTADLRWEGEGVNPHRKAGWMIRGGLDPGSPYVDAVVHGSGLISLQFRESAGGPTAEIQSPVSGPATLRLERDGDVLSLSISRNDGPFQPVGSISVTLPDPVYAGLIVCSHDNSIAETAAFSNVELRTMGTPKASDRVIESRLETITVATGERHIVYRARQHFEAPNWSRDGQSLLFNSSGRLYTIPVAGGEPKLLDTGVANKCNNDHGFSSDGKQLAISDQHDGDSRIYVLPSEGGTPRLVTPLGPSYWHGWSPDGTALAYCASRKGVFDIYTIPVEGGEERRLTDANGLDDGPDYSPDGKTIYFNSDRTGQMHIWRMNADSSAQDQVTSDSDYADWFPHPSPDGKLLIFLSYGRDVQGHPANKDVSLRIMELPAGKPKVLARLLGGQGTINVPSWSPDSRSVAFVSYRLIAP
jgi:alpha-L-fucosidase